MAAEEEKVRSALEAIPAAGLSYLEWTQVGMALKSEGFPCSAWEEWSSNDSRFHPGECDKKWDTFNDAGITIGTLFKLAQDRGWQYGNHGNYPWIGGVLSGNDGIVKTEAEPDVLQFKKYLEALFNDGEYVNVVPRAIQGDDGKWRPGSEGISFTKEQWLDLIEQRGQLNKVIGDYEQSAGAWIRFNPLDGEGVKNDNVTAFRYTLIESDTMKLEEQEEFYKKYNLPVAALVYSGGKSCHAIVKIDAKDKEEYRKRIDELHTFLIQRGFDVDGQNKNAARLSRFPGAMRNGKQQTLKFVNPEPADFAKWMEWAKNGCKALPKVVVPSWEVFENITFRPSIIKGILRRESALMIGGAPKSGKSFAVLQLAVCCATGAKWFHEWEINKKCNVLFLNFELREEEALDRFIHIFAALHGEYLPSPPENDPDDPDLEQKIRDYNSSLRELNKKHPFMDDFAEHIRFLNTRGTYIPNDNNGAFANYLNTEILAMGFRPDVIIIDPTYKLQQGDENSAGDIKILTDIFDQIITQTGAALVFTHHFSKGAQGGKDPMDRVSGSGVFGRYPDAIMTLTEIRLSEANREKLEMEDGARAFDVDFSLRSFASDKKVTCFFKYPLNYVSMKYKNIHDYVDAGVAGSIEDARAQNSRYNEEARTANEQKVLDAYDELKGSLPEGSDGFVTQAEIRKHLGYTGDKWKSTLSGVVKSLFSKGLIEINSNSAIKKLEL